MKKEVKDTIIVELGEQLKAFPHFYLVDLTGLDAAKTSDLRRKCFKNEIKLLVVKNKLLHKAFEASEIDFTPLYDCLKGNTAVMFTQTANVPAKLIKEYKKEGIPALKGAYDQEQERTYRRRCGSAAVSDQERCIWLECRWQDSRSA